MSTPLPYDNFERLNSLGLGSVSVFCSGTQGSMMILRTTEPSGSLPLKHLQGRGSTGLGITRKLSALHLQYMPLQPWTPDTPVWAFSCGGDQIQVHPRLRLPHFLLEPSTAALPQMMPGSDGNHTHLNTSFRAGEMAQWAKLLVAKPGFIEGVLKSIL